MTEKPLDSLCASAHRATAAAAVYTLVLVWLVRAPSGPETNPWGLVDWPWMGPVLLLLAQVVVLAGLIQLFHGLRSLARRLDRGEAAPPRGLRPFRTAAPPLAFALGVTAAILGAARGLSFLDFALWSFTPGAVALALRRLAPPLPGESRVRPDTRRLVSRLRGASMATAVAGLVLFLVSSSLAAGGLLPLLMLREIPHGPPPETLEAPWDLSAGGGGGGPSELVTAATAAGEAIQTLLFTGSPRGLAPLELPPVRRPPPWWTGETPPPLPMPPHEWARSLHGAAVGGELSPDGLAFMEAMSRHPGNREFDALAGAARADVAGTRWKPLNGRRVASFELPVPRYVELWSGVRGRIAGAFHLALAGRDREARRRLSTVIHLGRLLYTDGPLALDAVVGSAVAREGLMALDALDGIAPHRRAGAGTPESLPASTRDFDSRLAWLRAHRAALEDPTLARGVRWEGFMLLRTFQPCGSLSAVLWGPNEDAEAWSRNVVQSLAAYPSERAMAQILTEGYLGTRAGADGWGWLPKILGLTLARRPVVSHCAPVAAAAMQ